MPAVAAKPLRLPPLEAPRFELPHRMLPGWVDTQTLIDSWNRQALVDAWMKGVSDRWAMRTIRGYYLGQSARRFVPRRGFLVQPPRMPPILQPVPPLLAPSRLATYARTRSIWTMRLGSTGFIGAAISVLVQAAQSVFRGPPPIDRFRRALASSGGDYLGGGSKDLVARGARSLATSPLLAAPIVAGAPEPAIRVDARGFGQALKKYWETVGGDLGEILRTQTRLVTERCIDLTPPFSGKRLTRMLGGGDFGRTTAKGIGEARVKRDIERVFVPVNQLAIWRTMQEFRNAVDRRDTEEITRLLGPKFRFVNITPSPTPSLHQTQRNRRGNVRSKPQQQLILVPGNVEKYVKQRQKWVGFAKAGWGEAARKFGAKLPAWVARHNAPGFAYDLTGQEVMSTRIGNQVGYIQAKGRELRIVELAVTAQEKAMVSNIKRILRERNQIKA